MSKEKLRQRLLEIRRLREAKAEQEAAAVRQRNLAVFFEPVFTLVGALRELGVTFPSGWGPPRLSPDEGTLRRAAAAVASSPSISFCIDVNWQLVIDVLTPGEDPAEWMLRGRVRGQHYDDREVRVRNADELAGWLADVVADFAYEFPDHEPPPSDKLDDAERTRVIDLNE